MGDRCNSAQLHDLRRDIVATKPTSPRLLTASQRAEILRVLDATDRTDLQEAFRAEMRLREEAPKNLGLCPKCRNWSPHEAPYVQRPDVNEGPPESLLKYLDKHWAHNPMADMPFPSMADEGFVVRCGVCSFAWYEPMEGDNG
jgi:hypothetical protein